MASVTGFRNGMIIRVEGELYQVVGFQHVNPGNWRAFIRTRLKNVKSGKVIERTFRTSDKIDEVRLEKREMQFLYASDHHYVFMDTRTYDQVHVDSEVVGDAARFLKGGLLVNIAVDEQNHPLLVELPIHVELAVTRTEPGVKGDTVSGASKPATLETGAVIQVPLFINEGDVLKIDTRTGEYVERV